MTRSKSPSNAQQLRDYNLPSRPKGGGAIARLSGKDIAALCKAREGRWQPGLTDQPLHSEIFASAQDASGAGLALALARDALQVEAQAQTDAIKRGENPLAEVEDRRQVLWVQDRRAMQLTGRPYLHGLPSDLQDRVIHVAAERPEDALFALEEGLKCRDFACVIGEIVGNPRALDFTASRRLSLAAEKHNIALWLVRIEAQRDLSSARMRWQAAPAPSSPPRWNAQAPGMPAWRAELFRAARYAPGQWTLMGNLSDDKGHLELAYKRSKRPPEPANTQDYTADFGDLVRPTVGRSLAAFARG
ncbi:MAG: recA-like protein [Pseudomonadota bacterium]